MEGEIMVRTFYLDAMSQRHGLIKLTENRLHRRYQSICPYLVDYLLHLFRLLSSLFQPARLAEIHQHPLRPRRDEGSTRGNQDLPTPHTGRRDLRELCGSILEVLQELLHWLLMYEGILLRSTRVVDQHGPVNALEDKKAACGSPNDSESFYKRLDILQRSCTAQNGQR